MSVQMGLFLEQEGLSFDAAVALAQAAERADLASVWVQDHFFFGREALLEAFTLLGGLARATERVRLGSLVACASYRNPALLAKMAATLDRVSGGRFVLGLGAGWHEAEYEAYGYRFPPPGERVSRLEEALQVCRALWTEDRATFRGRYYRVEAAVCEPKPVQDPMPLWVGGGGPRLLRIAARHADGANLLSPSEGPFSLEECVRRMAWVERHRPTEAPFVFSIPGICALARDPGRVRRGAQRVLRKYAGRVGPLQALRTAVRHPGLVATYLGFLFGHGYPAFLFAGTPERVADQLRPFVDAGIDHVMLDLHSAGLGMEAFDLLRDEVLPAL